MTGSSIILILIWGLACPFVLGSLEACLTKSFEKLSIARNLCFGFVLELFVFGILALPLIFVRASYSALKYSWLFVIAILLCLSVFILYRHREELFSARDTGEKKKPDILTLSVWAAAIALIAFETGLLTFTMHMDADDARFVAEAVDAIDNDSLLYINPVTGEPTMGEGLLVGELRKDAASPYPIFLGLVSDLFGLNPAICAHTVMPALLIPLSFAVFYLIAMHFFDLDRKKSGIFLLFTAVIMLFSFESEFAPGYTLLNIIWQGRSIALCIMLPLLWYSFVRLRPKEGINAGELFLLIMINTACSVLSGTAAIVAAIITFAFAVSGAIEAGSIRHAVLTGLTAVPDLFCLVYGQYILKAIYKI